MCFSVRTHSHSRIVNRRAKYLMGVGGASAIPSDCVFDNSHCEIVTLVNEHRFASDFGHLLATYQNLTVSEKSD